MAKKTITFEVKSKIGGAEKDIKKLDKEVKKAKKSTEELGDEAKNTARQFQLFGISLDTIKGGFTKITGVAKLMFGSIKAGMISTGIGALVVAVGSLITYFTGTERGARKLEVVMSQLGATFDVIKDRVSGLGETLLGIFNRPFSETLTGIKNSFSGINEEIKEEVKLTKELTESNQELKDAQLDLTLETARTRAEIEKYKKDAEDVTKTITERQIAAQKGYDLENSLLEKQLSLKAKEIANAQALVNMSESTFADKEALVGLQIELADLEQQSTTKQIELQNKKNALDKEANMIIQEAIDKKKEERELMIEQDDKDREDKLEKEQDYLDKLGEIYEAADTSMVDKNYEALLLAEENRHQVVLDQIDAMEVEENQKNELRLAAGEVNLTNQKALAEMEKQINRDKSDAIKFASMDLAQALIGLAGESKMLARASVVIDTAKGVMKAYGEGGPLGFIGAATVVAAGLKSLKSIDEVKVGGDTGSLGGSISSSISAPAVPPSPQMLSGNFALGKGEEQKPLKAYVVTDEITDSQSGLNKIRERATI